MKIGFVLDDGLDKPDGVQQYILQLGQYYQSQGHEVRYLVGETARKDIPNVYSLAKNIKVSFNGNTLSVPLPSSARNIKRVLAQESFDVLHVQIPHSPFMGARVVRYADKQTVIVGTFHILPFGWLADIGTRLLGLALRKNLKRFNAFVSVSQPAAAFAHKTFAIRSQVISNPITLDRFRPKKLHKTATSTRANNNSSLKLVFLGRLVARKGCMQLLEALQILHEQQGLPQHSQVAIYGDGPMRQELERYVQTHDLAEYVRFHGFIAETDKATALQSADMAIFPALAGESFGIVLLEAMAAGSGIVLGGDNPGYRSVFASIPEAIIAADDPVQMAEQLRVYMHDAALRRKLHRKQQSLVKGFDVSVIGNQLMALYLACKNEHTTR